MDDAQILNLAALTAEVASTWPLECAAHPEVGRDDEGRPTLVVHLVPLPDSVDELPKPDEWAGLAIARVRVAPRCIEVCMLERHDRKEGPVVARWHDPRLQLGTLQGENVVVNYLRNMAGALRVGVEAGVYAMATSRGDAED